MEPKIGIITALTKEYTAVKSLLRAGQAHQTPGRGAGREYWLAKFPSERGGFHQVVVSLAGMGNNSASIRATRMELPAASYTRALIESIPGQKDTDLPQSESGRDTTQQTRTGAEPTEKKKISWLNTIR